MISMSSAAADATAACPPVDADASTQSVVAQKRQSPSGNTGDKLTTGIIARHDWLNVTAPEASRSLLQEFVERYLGPATPRERGANTYAQSVAWESGALLAWTDGRAECWLSLNGDTCDLILPECKLEFFHGLRLLGVKCTRCDAALDVPRDLLSMLDVHTAAESDQVVGFKRYDPRRTVADMRTGELVEDQARFGRRGRDGSGRYARVYDKGLESDGALDCVRVEIEFSGDVAGEVFDRLSSCSDQSQLTHTLGALVTGSIDFADKSSSHGHRDRFIRLGWWQKIVDLIGSATVAVERVKPSLERSIEYVKRVTPLLFARVVRAIDMAGESGEDLLHRFVDDLLERGREKLEVFGGAQPGDTRLNVAAVLQLGSPGW